MEFNKFHSLVGVCVGGGQFISTMRESKAKGTGLTEKENLKIRILEQAR